MIFMDGSVWCWGFCFGREGQKGFLDSVAELYDFGSR